MVCPPMKKARRRESAPAPAAPPSPWTPWLWYLAAGLAAWSFGYTLMRGSDLWWHIAGGRWMVEHATLHVGDPYSYTAAGKPWLNDAWLSDVLLYLWVRAFGLETLALWKWGLIVLTWVLLFRLNRRLSGDSIAGWVAITLGLAVAAPFLDVRPQLYSFLGFVLLLEGTVGRERPRPWLPLLMWIWVNLHASFLLGLIAIPILFLPALIEGKDRQRLLLLAAACYLVCLVNPNGAEVVTRPLRYALDPSSPFRTLGEWLPPFQPGGIRSWAYPYGIAAFALAVVSQLAGERRREPWTWAMIAVGGLCLAMSLRSRRFVPFFGLAQSLIVARAVAALSLEKVLSSYAARHLASPGAQTAATLLPPLAAIGVGLFWLAPYPRDLYAFDYMTAKYEFPVATVDFMEANQLSGNVFALYNWGGYIHLRSGGRLKVFIDGRSETVYSDQTFLQYMRVLGESAGWQEMIEQSGADYILWPRRQVSLLQKLVESGRWKMLARDYVSVLLRRSDRDPGELKPAPESAYQLLASGYDDLTQNDVPEAIRKLERSLALEPHLQTACTTLAQAQMLGGDLAAARGTADRCRSLYPNPERDTLLENLLSQARARTGR